MTRLSSLRKCLYIIIYLFIYLFISYLFIWGGGVAILIKKPSKYTQMPRHKFSKVISIHFLVRVMRELNKVSTCKHLPFLSLRCIDIVSRKLMLVTHDLEGLRPKPKVPHCLETFAHSFFDEFSFAIDVYEMNQASFFFFISYQAAYIPYLFE